MRHTMILSFLLFTMGFVLGVSLSSHYSTTDYANPESILGLLDQEFNMNRVTFANIFVNNLKVVLLLSFGGALTFGGLTLLNLVANGVNLGTLFYDFLIIRDIKTFLILLLPHGIFEIPAIVVAGAAGFKIPYELLRFVLGRKGEIISEEDAKEFFKLVAISVIMILIAALIESTVTLKIAEGLG
ncbi:stage II sporulation protein M [Thermococcus sp. 21S7]|uniref:stage II sporulation protein M n=1 Tax=Thermococcus sp. 21S7 TaxID=1638221 RepID=UPI00143AFBCD|nr:stage II sporulation protein M [Thermococcus sp. 21S7]NJE61370.1 stage II sporulation protein M [Thermococcus sp. 21S7]